MTTAKPVGAHDHDPAVAAPTPKRPLLARVPPGLFGIALGTLGLAGAWQRLEPLAGPVAGGVALLLRDGGLAILLVLSLLWLAKLARHPGVVASEWKHPVAGSLLALLPLSWLLAIALVAPVAPAWRDVGLWFTLALLALQGTLAWQVVAQLSTGRLPSETVSPALYLPLVGGGFVGAMTLAALGLTGWAALLFGMGAGGWALLEVRILHRLFAGPLSPELRPTLGIEIAPAAVGTLTVAVLWPLLPGEFLMIGLGIASGPVFAVLTRWRWWTAVPFTAGFWSFSFPLAALAGAAVEAVRRAGWPAEVALAAVVIASAVIAYLALRTVMLLFAGRLLPPR
jgi:tellurite resistance protein